MNIKKDIFWRVYLTFILFVLGGVAVLVQVFKIQNVEGEHWRSMADSLTTRYQNIDPVRGNILSSDGSLMAASMPVYEIRMDPNTESLTDEFFYEHVDSLAYYLSAYFGDKSTAQYRSMLVNSRQSGQRYLLIRRSVNHHQLKDISKFPLFREGRFRGGLIVEQRTARLNPLQMLARRTIGYHSEHVRSVGLEGAYDEYLAGKSGKRLMQRVSGGTWIPINDINELEPRDGMDIITTIDMNIQDVTESALLRQLQTHKARHGTAVVMEVSTGRIKAIANLKRLNDGSYQEFYNYAVGESAEPGSTFKLASMLALLENSRYKNDDTIDTYDGTIEFFDRIMKDHQEGGFGRISLEDAFAVSSNVAISKLVNEQFSRNPDRFINYLKDIHLDQPLGLPIAGEGRPLIKSPSDNDWSGTTLPWMSIGYEVKITPLQMLTLYNAVANDGKMVRPRFVDQIMDVGRVVKQFDTETIHPRIASDHSIEQVRAMLKKVVDDGTASHLKSDNYSISGKTGTALIASAHGYGGEFGKLYVSSFCGFFPSENPLYSIIVVINGASSGVYHGGQVAGPVFREVSDKIFAKSLPMHLAMDYENESKPGKSNVPARTPSIITQDFYQLTRILNLPHDRKSRITDWGRASVNDSLLTFENVQPEADKIPDVRGMVISDALYLLESQGLNVKTNGTGRVVAQSVLPGTPPTRGREIVLRLN